MPFFTSNDANAKVFAALLAGPAWLAAAALLMSIAPPSIAALALLVMGLSLLGAPILCMVLGYRFASKGQGREAIIVRFVTWIALSLVLAWAVSFFSHGLPANPDMV